MRWTPRVTRARRGGQGVPGWRGTLSRLPGAARPDPARRRPAPALCTCRCTCMTRVMPPPPPGRVHASWRKVLPSTSSMAAHTCFWMPRIMVSNRPRMLRGAGRGGRGRAGGEKRARGAAAGIRAGAARRRALIPPPRARAGGSGCAAGRGRAGVGSGLPGGVVNAGAQQRLGHLCDVVHWRQLLRQDKAGSTGRVVSGCRGPGSAQPCGRGGDIVRRRWRAAPRAAMHLGRGLHLHNRACGALGLRGGGRGAVGEARGRVGARYGLG